MITGAVEQLSADVDALLSQDFCAAGDAELIENLRQLETVRRRLAAVDVQLLAEVNSRRLAGVHARSTTAEVLISELRVTPGEARARVARAEELGPRRS